MTAHDHGRTRIHPSQVDPGVLGITEDQRRDATKALLRLDALDLRQILGLDQPVIEPDAQPEKIRPLHHTGDLHSGARRIA
ncbi:hypothetical protein [Acidipropionibacterium acidipropionici]|jgi:hypothetical protein|uniref:hypothetical protein n=1 Tax=Acidipropionibacterium acidipropionici TaxID=1748 RepID=UPI00110AA6D2|nr:hypothetical protein [Acidipropionibacterium acidipropionici]QCV95653.1 hypothetical protein FEZ30_10660 [Acidipropionibacterium acidipropionici]